MARVPLIIALPGGKNTGVSPRPVELVDLYPTLADLCGLRAPANLQGKSLRPLLENPRVRWLTPAITQQIRNFQGKTIMGYSVRTERWRYTEWDGGAAGAELYDHLADPHEWQNLAKDPRFARTATDLKKLLPLTKPENLPPPNPNKKKGKKRVLD